MLVEAVILAASLVPLKETGYLNDQEIAAIEELATTHCSYVAWSGSGSPVAKQIQSALESIGLEWSCKYTGA